MKLAALFQTLLCFGDCVSVDFMSNGTQVSKPEVDCREEFQLSDRPQYQKAKAMWFASRYRGGIRDLVAIEHHNSMLPISRLPVEILSEVFMYFAPPFNLEDLKIPTRQWLAFTQVCRMWRSIAINNPRIWTWPFFKTPRLAKEMIKRSGGLPLYIVTSGAELSSTPEAVPVLRSAEERNVRHLRFTMLHPEWEIFDWMACRGYAPFLEDISCSVLSADPQSGPNPYPVEDYQRIICPRLRTLYLRYTPFLLQTPQPLAHLVSLHIYGSGTILGGSLELPTLIGVLQSTPLLERLYLYNALVPSGTRSCSTENTGRILLSRLDMFTIHSSMEMIHEMMQRLEMPTVSILCVGCGVIEEWSRPLDLDVHNKAPLDTIFRDIQHLSPSWTKLTPKTMNIQTISLPFPPFRSFVLTLASSFPCHYNLRFEAHLTTGNQHIFLSRLGQQIALDNVTDLSLGQSEETGVPNHWGMYTMSSSVTHLSASGTTTAEHLVDTLRQSSPPMPSSIPFSKVSSIVLSNMDASEEMLDKLGRALSHRQRLGVPLPKLTFSRCPTISDVGFRKFINHVPLISVELTEDHR